MKAEFDRTIQDLTEDVTIPNFSTLSCSNFSEEKFSMERSHPKSGTNLVNKNDRLVPGVFFFLSWGHFSKITLAKLTHILINTLAYKT
jgi:hypothetical protein